MEIIFIKQNMRYYNYMLLWYLSLESISLLIKMDNKASNNNILSVKLNEYFKEKIKLSFVSDLSVIIVTKDDKVYEFQREGVKRIQYLVLLISDDKERIKSRHDVCQNILQ